MSEQQPYQPKVDRCEICAEQGREVDGPFGFGVKVREDKGRFYCRAHREEGAKRNGATIRR